MYSLLIKSDLKGSNIPSGESLHILPCSKAAWDLTIFCYRVLATFCSRFRFIGAKEIISRNSRFILMDIVLTSCFFLTRFVKLNGTVLSTASAEVFSCVNKLKMWSGPMMRSSGWFLTAVFQVWPCIRWVFLTGNLSCQPTLKTRSASQLCDKLLLLLLWTWCPPDRFSLLFCCIFHGHPVDRQRYIEHIRVTVVTQLQRVSSHRNAVVNCQKKLSARTPLPPLFSPSYWHHSLIRTVAKTSTRHLIPVQSLALF